MAAVALPQYTKAVEKTRAAEAMVVLKAINDAQQRYFLENQTYTADLGLLDIEPPGTAVWDDTQQKNRYPTKNFIYASSGGANNYVNAYREANPLLPTNTRYGITFYQNSGTRACFWTNAKYEPICKSLGIDSTQTCDTTVSVENCYVLK